MRGEAAKSWTSTAGATVWTFKLRKGVEFSNGKTLTAEDVVASLNHHRGDKSRSGAKGLFSAVSEIKADGNDTVVVALSQGSVDFANSLTDTTSTSCQPRTARPTGSRASASVPT